MSIAAMTRLDSSGAVVHLYTLSHAVVESADNRWHLGAYAESHGHDLQQCSIDGVDCRDDIDEAHIGLGASPCQLVGSSDRRYQVIGRADWAEASLLLRDGVLVQ